MFYCKFSREGFSITGPTMGRSIYAPGRNQILYLYGYADFIGEHKLIPLLGQVIQNMFGPSSYIKQTYYYLTPLIYKKLYNNTRTHRCQSFVWFRRFCWL